MHRIQPVYRVNFDNPPPMSMRIRAANIDFDSPEYNTWLNDGDNFEMAPITRDTMFCVVETEVCLVYELCFRSDAAMTYFKMRWL